MTFIRTFREAADLMTRPPVDLMDLQ
jgi:hypothetical protein